MPQGTIIQQQTWDGGYEVAHVFTQDNIGGLAAYNVVLRFTLGEVVERVIASGPKAQYEAYNAACATLNFTEEAWS